MDLAQINQRIAVVNAESKRLNNERQVNIGKKETLKNQLSEAIKAYNATYNVNLTSDTIQAELESVARQTEAEVQNIETVLNLIKAGDYTGAEKVISGQTGVADNSASVVQEPVAPVVDSSVSVIQPEIPMTDTSIPEPPVIQTPVVSPPVPKAPKLTGLDTSIPDTSRDIPKAPKLTGLDMDIQDDIPVAPPAPPKMPVSSKSTSSKMPTPPAPPKMPSAPVVNKSQESQIRSFNAILGGTSFKPQG